MNLLGLGLKDLLTLLLAIYSAVISTILALKKLREYKYKVVPYTLLAIVSNLVANPMHSVSVSPTDGCLDCVSYLLTGGLVMTTPWVPTGYSSSSLIKLYNVTGRQVEFQRGMPGGDSFTDDDCSVFGQEDVLIGVRMCVARSQVYDGSFIAGM